MARGQNALAVLQRRLKIAALVAEGVTEPLDILQRLHIQTDNPLKTVEQDLRALKRNYKKLTTEKVEVMRGMEAARLLKIERDAHRAFRRSRRGTVIQREKRKVPRAEEDEDGRTLPSSGELQVVETETQIASSAGDPRFLQVAADCVHKRIGLFNLEVPKVKEKEQAGATYISVNIREFNNLTMAERLRLVRDGRIEITDDHDPALTEGDLQAGAKLLIAGPPATAGAAGGPPDPGGALEGGDGPGTRTLPAEYRVLDELVVLDARSPGGGGEDDPGAPLPAAVPVPRLAGDAQEDPPARGGGEESRDGRDLDHDPGLHP